MLGRGGRPVFLAGLLPLTIGACTVPDLNEQGKACTETCSGGLPCVGGVCGGALDASVSDGSLSARDATTAGDGSCSPPVAGNPCNTIPAFTGTQVLDGLGTDFCDVAVLAWNPANGIVASQDPTPPDPPVTVRVQIAWSASGVHMFAFVPKWPPAAPPPDGGVFLGDAVELFFAASTQDVTGHGDDPGAIHAISAPPLLDEDGGGTGVVYGNNAGGAAVVRSLAPTELRGRLYPGVGFAIELSLDWASFGGSPPDAGASVRFDLAADVLFTEADGGTHRFQSFLFASPQGDPNDVCASLTPLPYCDDRTWCTPTLE